MAFWHRTLSEMSFFSASRSRTNPFFTAGKAKQGYKLPRDLWTPGYAHFHIYSLCSRHGYDGSRLEVRDFASWKLKFFLFNPRVQRFWGHVRCFSFSRVAFKLANAALPVNDLNLKWTFVCAICYEWINIFGAELVIWSIDCSRIPLNIEKWIVNRFCVQFKFARARMKKTSLAAPVYVTVQCFVSFEATIL